ncbi:MAG: tRNA uridine-5-carboxymethylaminomethyl(34) synthesis enzyme MnmG [Mollicutes bacterium]|nr:tRNA uridine-5-carboxymethylaminomethyl(34) synthesis enzyme MnmG [Mollicutes bacterium]MDD7263542.1 tRNA uridine-5-carboxymethylaminomethyl(34) synthesis enzyme MnmG [bacterium]MDY4979933.1 tRNA uridine-5-carboxymethylaminomethyl(34) synthesis enzyme MnmG [Candidatus Onthovivens sp.]
MKKYDVIVVGGGHAGVEASLACANRGFATLLITLNFKMVSNMPCNPSIGGSAKGIVVREIDALGGFMGKAADHEYLQMKMLNTKKGPGVQCLRAQADKKRYPHFIQEHLKETKNLDILEDMVVDLLYDKSTVFGVKTSQNQDIFSKAVILATGTYMNSEILVGHNKTSGGPDGEKPSIGLSDSLKRMGIEIIRLKTGTPQRIAKESIDFSKGIIQLGNVEDEGFSYEDHDFIPISEQIPCWLIYTTPETHKIIKDNLLESAMYSGLVKGVGPRYCPSIEDKIVRFSDKPRHQLFLEPESYDTNSIYLQGFSTSMPIDVQDKMVHSLPGLENAKILKYAYAIEYDALDPTQFDTSLMVKKYKGLFIAGQICGTSGYEEAAGLGLMAGINAGQYIKNLPPFILNRDEAYIGVMIDDLITKGTKEPYRLLSSRAEYRLLLRHDNADLRLTEYGYKLGLISQSRYDEFIKKKKNIGVLQDYLKNNHFGRTSKVNDYLVELGYDRLENGVTYEDILKRNNVTFSRLKEYMVDYPSDIKLDPIGEKQLSILVKYAGYIENERVEALKAKKLESIKLPENFDYSKLDCLALEARQKFNKVQPKDIGQASRISGVNPSDINALIIHIKKGDLR